MDQEVLVDDHLVSSHGGVVVLALNGVEDDEYDRYFQNIAGKNHLLSMKGLQGAEYYPNPAQTNEPTAHWKFFACPATCSVRLPNCLTLTAFYCLLKKGRAEEC